MVVLKRLEIHPWLKNKKTAGLLILVILLLSFAVTLAYYSDVMTLANPLGTSHSGAAMVESFDPESSFLPGVYDKEQWIKYLDMLVANRMNSLYLWNGHPFASLVKLEDYPFALDH